MANNNKRRGGWGFSPSLTGPGSVFTIAFVALAIGMGVLLSRGVTPSSTLTEPESKDTEVELILETPAPGQKGLQLKTLKFRECGSTVTTHFLIDRSGSMREITPSGISKMDRLKAAVTELLAKAKDTSIVGIQSFDSNSITTDVPISFYRDVKPIIPGRIASWQPGGSTPTYEALKAALSELKTALPRFPDRKFNFIFVSDGAPCPGIGCPGTPGANQDPRLYTPNPADEIKALGVTVWSLGIFSSADSDPALAGLLKSIATSPTHYYAAATADDTSRLLSQISNKICSDALTPTPGT